MADTAAPEKPRPVQTIAAAQADEDVRPSDEIAAMVEEERRTGGEQETDLLDPSRPVE